MASNLQKQEDGEELSELEKMIGNNDSITNFFSINEDNLRTFKYLGYINSW